MFQLDTKLRETSTGKEPSLTNHLLLKFQLEDTTGPSMTSSTLRTESLMSTVHSHTLSSASARVKDAQPARTILVPSFKTFSTKLERIAAELVMLVTELLRKFKFDQLR